MCLGVNVAEPLPSTSLIVAHLDTWTVKPLSHKVFRTTNLGRVGQTGRVSVNLTTGTNSESLPSPYLRSRDVKSL